MITFDMEKYTQKGTFIGLKRVTAPDHTTSKRLGWAGLIKLFLHRLWLRQLPEIHKIYLEFTNSALSSLWPVY